MFKVILLLFIGVTNLPNISSAVVDDGRTDGLTLRYWDCCKSSCGWNDKASVTNPVQACDKDGCAPVSAKKASSCDNGPAYVCNSQQPWSVSSTLSYGYAAANISGQGECDWCCACYSLIFTSVPVVDKEMIVQVTNTGAFGANHFSLQIPGGGFGHDVKGCKNQFGDSYSWGQLSGGVSQRAECDKIPEALRSGCLWRFDWFANATNPTIRFKPVSCPACLTANTTCMRKS